MRPDMHKVVTESPRHGGDSERHRPSHKGEDWENYPKQEGIKRMWKDHKELSDLINPLYRYLAKQVGRPWDHVYSEISKVLDFRSVHGFHLKSHLYDSFGVQRHVRIIDGKPYEHTGYFVPTWNRGKVKDGWWLPLYSGQMYVHPIDGLLKKVPGERKTHNFPVRKKSPNVIDLTPGKKLEREQGIWYHVTYTTRDDSYVNEHGFRVQRVMNTRQKRQLDTKQLRRYGVANDAVVA